MDAKTSETIQICPASLFFNTLIVLFGPEPKQFLHESPNYLRPVLFISSSESNEEVAFNQLQHRAHYRLVFQEQPKLGLSKASVAYTSDE